MKLNPSLYLKKVLDINKGRVFFTSSYVAVFVFVFVFAHMMKFETR
jgi:hypothetical protein